MQVTLVTGVSPAVYSEPAKVGSLMENDNIENLEVAKTETVSVPKSPADQQIETRLRRIADVAQRYDKAQIAVDEGLVVLSGQIKKTADIEWIKEISLKTEGVVAFIDRSELEVGEVVDLDSTTLEIHAFQKSLQTAVPYMVSSGIVLSLTLIVCALVSWVGRRFAFKRVENFFIRKTLSRVIAFPFFCIGLFLTFRVSGLSGLAAGLLGGTGLVGLGIGFALKNFFENYFSSVVLSLRKQFNRGDLIEIEGHQGVIQSITTQGTTLMDYDGNNILIPNSKFFSNIVKNYTLNPNMRLNFVVGIGYDDKILTAQATILKTLLSLDTIVLKTPEPMIAVDKLASSTVNIKVYFWIDYSKVSHIKALSVVLKMVKEALIDAQISMPDDAREVVFSSPLQIIKDSVETKAKPVATKSSETKDLESKIEGNISNEIQDIKIQAENLHDELAENKQ